MFSCEYCEIFKNTFFFRWLLLKSIFLFHKKNYLVLTQILPAVSLSCDGWNVLLCISFSCENTHIYILQFNFKPITQMIYL